MKHLIVNTLIAVSCCCLLSCTSAKPTQDFDAVGPNIKTLWAAEVTPDNARPEYPRPQMVRGNWQNLNGLWEYSITPREVSQMPQTADGNILVPFCVESSLSGVGKRVSGEEALWYRTTLEAPENCAGKTVLLHFGAVDWQAEVFIDGELAATHTGGYTSFDVDVTKWLEKGSAELVVKVWDPTDDRQASIPRGKQVSEPRGIWYTPVTGIWQTVWMEQVPQSYIADYNVETQLDGTIKVDAVVVGDADLVKVEVLCPKIGYNPEKPAWGLFKKGKAEVAPGRMAVIKLNNPKLWSTETPWLYGLRIKLVKDGKEIDCVDGYAAVRTVSVKENEAGLKRIALNDEIVFQFGPLDQGWWPDGLYTAPTAEAMAFDIIKTKELGFNMIRKHIKVEPDRWYYDCDRLGIAVWQDMPCIGEYDARADWAQGEDFYGAGNDYVTSEASKSNYYKEWGEIISQLKKHPSIVCWVPFNEAWGQFDTKKAVEFTRTLDPTRLINAASGGNWIKGAGDILDSHHYPNPEMRIIDPQMVNVLGEYGGIGRPIEGHVWEIDRKWGYVQYDTEEKVTDTYCMYAKDLLDLKQNDLCAAAVYTQTTDVEGEVNGFYTYDRAILKMNGERVRKANLEVINAACVPSVKLVQPSKFHYKDSTMTMKGHYHLYTLRSGDIIMQVTDFGARVISIFTPDKNGNLDDIVVGYGELERFIHNKGERFLGATVGRVANRIAGGRFSLDGVTYTLPQNNGANCLHGGLIGVDMMKWDVVERTPSSITFSCVVPDGQDGFPGNLTVELKYTLTEDNCFDIAYKATTDKATPVNLSNHAFFNLKGTEGGTILDHTIQIDADSITEIDSQLIPTGKLMSVEGTPFDFREPHVIGERINADHYQIGYGSGYDHNWVLNAPSDGEIHKVCTLSEESTGRVLEVYTDQPGMQFYAGNFFDGTYCGKGDVVIGHRDALALETQKFPDAVNHPNFPNTVLRPSETYTQHTVYKFLAK